MWDMNRFKRAILITTEAIAALALMFAPAVPAFAQDTAQQQINAGLCTGSNLQFSENTSTADCSTSDATERVNNLIHTIVNLLSAVVGIVAVIMIIFGGLRYITSGGNDSSVTGAKNTILYAIIGLIIVALAQVLVRFTLNKVTNS
jgi:heme/copper-type cytochrome/quinol oxidase subunit 2